MTIESTRQTFDLDDKRTLIMRATTDTTGEKVGDMAHTISVRYSARYYLKTRWRTREITEQEAHKLLFTVTPTTINE